MKLTLLIILLLLICIVSSTACHAVEFITFSNEPMTRVEYMVKLQVEKHRTGTQVNSSYTNVAPIDGVEPSVQISDSRTSLPDEFIDLPKKPNPNKGN